MDTHHNTHGATGNDAAGDTQTLGESLIEAMREIVAVERGEEEPSVSYVYEGPVMTEVRENGKAVWLLADVEVELPPAGIGGPDGLGFSVLRKELRQSQPGMAALLGVPLATVRGWDQGRRTPRGPASRLLLVAARHPGALLDLPLAA